MSYGIFVYNSPKDIFYYDDMMYKKMNEKPKPKVQIKDDFIYVIDKPMGPHFILVFDIQINNLETSLI